MEAEDRHAEPGRFLTGKHGQLSNGALRGKADALGGENDLAAGRPTRSMSAIGTLRTSPVTKLVSACGMLRVVEGVLRPKGAR